MCGLVRQRRVQPVSQLSQAAGGQAVGAPPIAARGHQFGLGPQRQQVGVVGPALQQAVQALGVGHVQRVRQRRAGAGTHLGQQGRGHGAAGVLAVAQGHRVDQRAPQCAGGCGVAPRQVGIAQRLGLVGACGVVDVGPELPGHTPGAQRAGRVGRQRGLEHAHRFLLIEGVGLAQALVEVLLGRGRWAAGGHAGLAVAAQQRRRGGQVRLQSGHGAGAQQQQGQAGQALRTAAGAVAPRVVCGQHVGLRLHGRSGGLAWPACMRSHRSASTPAG